MEMTSSGTGLANIAIRDTINLRAIPAKDQGDPATSYQTLMQTDLADRRIL